MGLLTDLLGDGNATSTSLWVPAGLFQKVAGSPTLDTSRTGGNGWPAWFLDAASAEAIQVATLAPPEWGAINVSVYWSNGGAGAGDVVFNTAWSHQGAGENISSMTAGTTKTVTAPSQFILKVTTMDAGLTLDSTELTSIRLARVAADAADTLANDCVVFGVLLGKA